MISLILVMAGSGQRMNMNINKVLLPLKGKPIYEYSLDLFKEFGFELICVINPNDKIEKRSDVTYVNGGKTRGESVYNGLMAASGDYVFIHDAARPLISRNVIKGILDNLNKNEAYLCYLKSIDTLKLVKDNNLVTLNRDEIIRAATPQCAPKDILIDSYNKALSDKLSFTDDASLIEHYHKEVKINLVEANQESFKITTEFDYKMAKAIVEDL